MRESGATSSRPVAPLSQGLAQRLLRVPETAETE